MVHGGGGGWVGEGVIFQNNDIVMKIHSVPPCVTLSMRLSLGKAAFLCFLFNRKVGN